MNTLRRALLVTALVAAVVGGLSLIGQGQRHGGAGERQLTMAEVAAKVECSDLQPAGVRQSVREVATCTKDGQRVDLYTFIDNDQRDSYIQQVRTLEKIVAGSAAAGMTGTLQQGTSWVAQIGALHGPEKTFPPPPVDPGNGATALCNDGTYSDAAHHQGACSHHGGVKVFYK